MNFAGRDVERIRDAALLIQQNLDKPLTIMDLVQQIGMNQTKFKNGFKAVFNDTIFGYLQKTRMSPAQILLLDTNMPVQQIGILSGYNNTSNFSIAFKQTYGYPPSRLRGKV